MREVERMKEVKLKELIQRSKAKKENELVTVIKQQEVSQNYQIR